jgi:glycosyltransferase involved in cell wall biosynthesis
MRIALLTPTLEIGGVERVFVNLANGLHECRSEVEFVVGWGGGAMTRALNRKIPVFDLKSKRMIRSVPRLASYLKRRSPDVVIAAMTHSTAAVLLARAISCTKPIVIATEHNTMSSVVANTRGLKFRLMPYWSRLALDSADLIVAVSAGVADDLSTQTGIARDKIQVIYNPVIASSLFSDAASDPGHPWFQPGEPPVVLSVGRLEKQKDFPMLVRAFSLVTVRHRARLMILGEGPERDTLERTVSDLGLTEQVALPGAKLNPYPFVSRAAVFALPSQWEGFGVVLVEALALGVPVVSTNCAHGPLEILDEGKLGMLVPVGDYQAMAGALLFALDNPVRRNVSPKLEHFGVRAAAMHYLSALHWVQKQRLSAVYD